MSPEKKIYGEKRGKIRRKQKQTRPGAEWRSMLRESVPGSCYKCGSESLRFYDGWFGYKSIVCEKCGVDQADNRGKAVCDG
jgi:hypothetical protein